MAPRYPTQVTVPITDEMLAFLQKRSRARQRTMAEEVRRMIERAQASEQNHTPPGAQ